MTGIFSSWQPEYAARGIATFPVREKRPAVSGYLKMGLTASQQLAIKFPNDNAFGVACRRNRITILDVDAPDERLLADALSEFGPTPFIVRSGSGNFQAWYQHNGEKRRVRPDPKRPIDVLGDGYVVAPPSEAAKGRYSIIQGSLDDLGRLPAMRRPESAFETPATPQLIDTGRRNGALWRECMKRARECREVTELMRVAVELNKTIFYEPLPDEEVLRVVASAWAKECSGDNWFGRGGRVVFDAAEIDIVLDDDPDSFILLAILRRHHWGSREFVVANGMHGSMPGGGWTLKRFTGARRRLEAAGDIVVIRKHSKHSPSVYRFKGGQK